MFQIWLAAARPRTLWAALAPVLVGSALAMSDGVNHAPSASLALLAAMLMQIGTMIAIRMFRVVRSRVR